jgi:hypothetical protein
MVELEWEKKGALLSGETATVWTGGQFRLGLRIDTQNCGQLGLWFLVARPNGNCL